MILRSVTLEDFGLYAGITKLNLVPRTKLGGPTPIVLIGGKNGAGKTTLLEAVRLALYGKRALGARVAQSEYDDYLRGRINHMAAAPAASVALEFDYAEAGVVHRYRIRREWTARSKSVAESLDLLKDGEPVSSVPRDEWHAFLQELIPPGVSQLFFFDGEKISEIAEGEQDNEQLGEAVRGLLGIELVGRLRVDLGLYIARRLREGDAGIGDRLEAVNRDIAVAEREAGELAGEVAELTAQRESQARSAEQVRRQFVAEGGDAAVHRDRIERERDDVRRAVQRTEHELRELANKLLPFAMAPRLVSAFRAALEAAGQAGEHPGAADIIAGAVEYWRAESAPRRSATWSAKHWEDLARFLAAQSPSMAAVADSPAFREVGDGATAVARFSEIETSVRPAARTLLQQMDELQARGRDLDTRLSRADNAAAGVVLDDLRIADQKVGATEERLRALQDSLKLRRGQIVTLTREQRRLLEEQTGSAKASERADMAVRTAQALADYEQRLLDHKLGQLRAEFVRCFNHLARKGALVADVRIDSKTFATTLIAADGRELAKTALSAGEKQIYAIAMLWALARTSGRALPMIIDTPLARLDSEHRANLVSRYFPAASHQVILLSTDTEVDGELFDQLKPAVSHTYHLEYDQADGRTRVKGGYFDHHADRGESYRALQQA
jgi:DNA sulfur modification protein DndD